MTLALHTRTDTDVLLLEALDQRLLAAATCLAPAVAAQVVARGSIPVGWVSAELLPQLLVACAVEPGPSHWLVITSVIGAFPEAPDVEGLARDLALKSPEEVAHDLLSRALAAPGLGRLDLPMEVVSDSVVVDVDYCARFDNNTGIQRVVRETLPRWNADHQIVAVTILDQRTAYRSLSPRELARVFEFGKDVVIDLAEEAAYAPVLVVPWQTTVIWPEVVDPHACLRMACLAQYSGNTIGLIAYDMIPILSTELRPFGEAGIFARFLSAVKHAHRVAGISNSATTEFRGFAEMLSAQGLPGPDVAEVELAEDVGEHTAEAVGLYASTRPVVLLTGRREPHKNLRASVHAAQRLWAEGLDFEVVMLGGRGWDEEELTATVERLQAEGRPLTTLGWVSDAEMWGRIRDASFVVFASLHEGYGLPISEALACGTPVITSNYGSQREVAAKGGCLLVDPRSDEELTRAMRTLITDPGRLTGLRAEIPDRPQRTWGDYAAELWNFLVEGSKAGHAVR